MSNEVIKADDYGIAENKANELTVGLNVVRAERELLIKEFDELSKLEITHENISKFKELRLRIVKNRTGGINKWHKANKSFFLTGGKFVDAIKNVETNINEGMETKLMDAEKYFERIEEARILKIQKSREGLLSEFVENASEINLSSMDEDVWNAFLEVSKKKFLDKVKEEEAAKNKEIEDRVSEALKNKEIEIEAKKIAESEIKKAIESSKGDSDKMKDLIYDLESIRGKYSFESKKYKKINSSVNTLINKIITFINEK